MPGKIATDCATPMKSAPSHPTRVLTSPPRATSRAPAISAASSPSTPTNATTVPATTEATSAAAIGTSSSGRKARPCTQRVLHMKQPVTRSMVPAKAGSSKRASIQSPTARTTTTAGIVATTSQATYSHDSRSRRMHPVQSAVTRSR